jgi:TP901 family phage tail tape measure protein
MAEVRYGGGDEGFERARAALEAQNKALDELAAKEAAYERELAASAGAEDEATKRRAQANRLRREQAELAEREARVAGQAAPKTRVETDEIERNTRARQRATAAARDHAKALQGARDPLFGRAYQVAGGQTGLRPDQVSQYALRRQLQIGSARAARLQEALAAGITPSTGYDRPIGPPHPTQQLALDREKALAQQREAAAALRKLPSGASDAERLALIAARDEAAARAQTAKDKLESGRKETTAVNANAEAARKEAEMRKRATGGPGQALIRHPTLYGQPRLAGQREAYPPFAAEFAGREGYQQREVPYGTRQPVREVDDRAATLARTRAAAERVKNEEMQRGIALERENAARLRMSSQALRTSSVNLGTLDNAMFRHGALSSEFIEAAARGEVTLRQLGQQALVTAGKFAGWTLAATAIYGVVAAIGRMGTGAITASSGVDTLSRVIDNVDSGQARGDFNALSREFNVPLDETVDAVYRMGQVFHDQADATLAAKAALYSLKTGEVDVATSTKNLIAIQQGFQLSAAELVGIFDQINQAQNQFGISIADTEQGLAKAAGVYKGAGGDLSTLLGLFVAIQKATGRSGTEIGTGIARGVNQIRQGVNQAKLEAQGVEVIPQNFQQTLLNAIERAQQPGADLQQIATGLLGNQYARLIAPVLASDELFKKAMRDTSPEQAKGSAQKELQRVLSQTDEQIRRVGIGLERMGNALGEAGAFDALGGLLYVLNQVLDVTTRVVELFNNIPSPIREGLVYLAQLMLLMRGLRRFGATERLAQVPGLSFMGRPDERMKVHAIQGQRTFATRMSDETRGLADREVQARLIALGAAEDAAAARRRFNQTDFEGDAAKKKAVDDEVKNTEQHAKNKAAQAEQARKDMERQRDVAQRADDTTRRMQTMTPAQIRAEMDKESGAIPRNLAPGLEGYDKGGSAWMKRLDDRTKDYTARLRDMNALQRLGVSGRMLDSAGRGAARAVTVAERGVRGIRQFPTALMTGMRGLVAGLGPLDVLLGAVGAYFAFIQPMLAEMEAKFSAFDAQIVKTPGNAGQLRQLRSQLDAKIDQQLTPLEEFLSNGPITNLYYRLRGVESPRDTLNRQQQMAEQRRKALDNLRDAQQRQDRAGGPVANLFPEQVQNRIQQNADDLAAGIISMDRFREEYRQRLIEIKRSTRIGPKGERKLLAEARADFRSALAAADPAAFTDSISEMTDEEVKTWGQLFSQQMGRRGAQVSERTVRNQVARARTLLQRAWAQSDPAKIAELQEQADETIETILGGVTREMEEGYELSRTEGGRRAAQQRARAGLRRLTSAARANRNAARDRLELARERAQAAREELREMEEEGYGGPRGDAPGGVRREARRRMRAKLDQVRAAQKDVQKADRDHTDAVRRYRLERAKLEREMFQDREQGRSISLALAQARTADPQQQARLAVQYAQRSVRDAERFGRGSREYRQALTALFEARRQAAENIIQNIEAEGRLAVARAGGDELGAARAGLQSAQRILAYMRQRRGQFSKAQILQQQAEIIEQQRQVDEAIRDRIAARFELLESLTTDPVRQATLQRRAAREAITGTRGAERTRAVAEYNRARQNERDVRLQDRMDTIDFERSMERISISTAIAKYESLLKLHNLTKQQRRDILLKIKGLREEAEGESKGFDLDVGGIKLPTLYDIRRGFDPIRRAMKDARNVARDTIDASDIRSNVSHLYNSRAEVNANISVYVNDKNAAGAVYRAIDDAMGTHVRARMRSRGQR